MTVFVNQNNTRREVAKIWVNQGGTVTEVKSGWANQAGNTRQIYSTSVAAVVPPNSNFHNLRTSTTSLAYGARLNDFLPSGTLASASAVVNLDISSGTISGGRGGGRTGGLNDNSFWGRNSGNRAEASPPAIYVGGANRNASDPIPSLSADEMFPDGLILNINISGGTLYGGAGRAGRGPCNNHGCHNTNGNNSGGSGGPIILIDGVNNATVNVTITGGSIRAGGGGGAGGGWGAGHSQCCPKWGGGGAGGIVNGSTTRTVGPNAEGGPDAASHGGNRGSNGGNYGADGGNNSGWPGGLGGSLLEFRNCASPSYTVTGSAGTVRNTAVTTTRANSTGHSTI